jgi:hypothetical protein
MSADGRYLAVEAAFEADSPSRTGYVYDRMKRRWHQICPVVRLCLPRAISPDGRYTGQRVRGGEPAAELENGAAAV